MNRVQGLLIGAMFAGLCALGTATAQNTEAGGDSGRRAPLAGIDDVGPAVNVGGPAPRAQETPSAPAAPSAPRTPEAPPPAGASRAIDALDLGTTSITGSQELPKVLYIVPWKRSDLGDLVGRPVNTLLDEVLAPVDPDVFERQLNYYETLHGSSQEE